MASLESLPPPVQLVVFAGVGRLLLACVPAGPPGRHAPRELAFTWATAHVLGLAALGAELALLDALDLAASAWIVLLPWLAVLAARVATLPGSMVPRHEPRAERPGPLARLLALAPLAAAFAVARGSAEAPAGHDAAIGVGPDALGVELAPASLLAAALLVAHGLSTSRRAPAGRWAVAAGFAFAPWIVALAQPHGSASIGALAAFTAAAAFAFAWLRRADRRGRALALVLLACLPAFEARLLPWSLVGLAALALATARPARPRSLGLATLAALAGLAVAAGGWRGSGAFVQVAPEAAVVALLAAALAAASALRPARRAAVDAPRRELAFLACAALGGSLLAASDRCAAPRGWNEGVAAALAALAIGLALVRAERPR